MSGIVGQNTLDNSGLIKAPAGGGAWNFIAKQTASTSADISFTSGIDKTIRWYLENEAWWKAIQDNTYQQERLGVVTE